MSIEYVIAFLVLGVAGVTFFYAFAKNRSVQ